MTPRALYLALGVVTVALGAMIVAVMLGPSPTSGRALLRRVNAHCNAVHDMLDEAKAKASPAIFARVEFDLDFCRARGPRPRPFDVNPWLRAIPVRDLDDPELGREEP